ncbi:uncharacterized protein LOC126896479 [Daktulosphaira vitifoliae]|uniref:uncharacterized protein LOC126896479 n=1 Tax=Daktulosphaira vitifoliae TaxID=58002 RepID=UPI0021AA0E4F|nr:uncharacterized protein LOC126896479 [Daktulosphaira vitifoliae]
MHPAILLKSFTNGLKSSNLSNVDVFGLLCSNAMRVSTAKLVHHKSFNNSKTSVLPNKHKNSFLISNRCYCKDYRPFPQVPEFPPIIWPNLLKSISSWLYAYIVIKPQYDKGFSLVEFSNNSKKAVEVVSRSIARRDFETLEGLVTSDVLEQVKSIVSNLNDDEIRDMAFKSEDMYFYFPYQVDIVTNEQLKDRRFIEVTMCYHAIHNLEEIKKRNEDMEDIQKELKSSIYVLNYRFIREYSKGVEDAWTVNAINHLKAEEHDKTMF